MERTRSRKLNNGRGYTLAELLIVVAITLVLLAIGMLAIVQYVKAMKLTEMDNAAKDIFIAAQNHLTAAEAAGRVDAYLNNDAEGDVQGNPTSANGQDVFGKHITAYKPDDYDDKRGTPDFENDYYYLIYTPGAGGDSDVLDDSFLKQLLPFGSIDDELRTAGSYIIEYNPADADVYGVFYTDEFNLSVTDIAAITNDGGRHYTKEGKKVRKNYEDGVVGYYGGAMADGLVVEALDPLKIEIKNEDILTVKVTDPNYFTKADNLGLGAAANDPFAAQLPGSSSAGILGTNITLAVAGELSGEEKLLKFPLTGSALEPQADTGNNDSTIKYWTVKKETVAGKDVLVYEINLDDISKQEDGNSSNYNAARFCKLFPKFIPGENLTVTARGNISSGNAAVMIPEDTAAVNSLFDNVVVGKDCFGGDLTDPKSATAEVSCIRHLENLDGTISNISRSGTVKPNEPCIEYVSVVGDIDWQTFFGKQGDEKTILGHTSNPNIEPGTYYPIMRSDLRAFNGNGYTIKNIAIDNKATSSGNSSNYDSGLIRALNPAGNSFEFRNLILKDFDVKGHYNAAMLFGETAKKLDRLTIKNVIVDGGSVSTDASAAGSNGCSAAGLFGFSDSKRTTIENCGATVKATNTNKNTNAAGKSKAKAAGFIGQINGGDSSAITITDCYAGGYTVKGEYTDNYNATADGEGYAGGFIAATGGTCRIKIQNCFNACSAKGQYAGGFIGQRLGTSGANTNAAINNCYSIAKIHANNAAGGGTFVGGGAGVNTTNTSIADSYYLYMPGVHDPNMKAYGSLNADGGAAVKGYDELEAMTKAGEYAERRSSGDHRGLDSSLDSITYPFRAVTKEVVNVKADADCTGNNLIYYGDWLTEKIESLTYMFAYREHMSGEPSNAYHWSLIGTEEDGKSTKIYNGLVKDKNKYADSYSYGFLSATQLGQKDFDHSNYIDFNNSGPVTIKGKTYYYYPLNYSGTNDRITPAEWKVNGSANHTVSFKYNPGYGNSMGAKNTAAGSLNYEVRTASQLENVKSHRSYTFAQTCDIDLQLLNSEKSYDRAVVTGEFSGKYDAGGDNGIRYSVVNLKQTIEDSNSGEIQHSGLFEGIGTSGEVSNLIVNGAGVTVDSNAGQYIGILAGDCSGKIDNCSSNGSINIAISNNNSDTINAGGLVGQITAGAVSNSWSNAAINDTTDQDYAGKHTLGGLIGSAASQSSITNSYAITDYPSTGKQGSLLIGNSSNSSISYCHAAAKQKNELGIYELILSNNPFIKSLNNTNTLSSNYGLTSDGSLDALGVTQFKKFTTISEYSVLNNFTNLSTDIWEIAAGGAYPTLKSNPEPAASAAP